jgi:mannose-1-phosphate guanylyltransferase / mannose-6-phosphate isomerase
MSAKLVPVILSGGTGTRLWPVSREAHPKPFMQMADGQSLLQKTYARASTLDGVSTVLTITNREYYFKTRDDYAAVKGVSSGLERAFLLEPVGRNTAPAVALGALMVRERAGEDALMLVLSADHLIDNAAAFAKAVNAAIGLAIEGKLVTFGIEPSAPDTAFGYIERGAPIGTMDAYAVARFVEKPTLDLAEQYLASGNYYWNSGMFCFTAGAILDQLKSHAPGILERSVACWEKSRLKKESRPSTVELDAETFSAVTEISIDYAVMEKSRDVVVVPGNFGWSDVGSWSAVSELVRPDAAGNRVVGEAILVDAQNTFVRADSRIVAAIGTRNLLIVDTPDALLVADRDRSQDVKQVVQQLKMQEHETYKLHRTVTRPWGTYTLLEEGDRFKIKRIVVKPGGVLSLQMHHHRSEHWVVVSGLAKVVHETKEYCVQVNESTFIPAGHKHRVENPGKVDLVMIEVQSGQYLGEDDIVRFEDLYGRA